MREKLKPPKIGGELYQQADKSISEQPREGKIFSKNKVSALTRWLSISSLIIEVHFQGLKLRLYIVSDNPYKRILDQSSLIANTQKNPFNATTSLNTSIKSPSKIYGDLPPLKILALDCYAQEGVKGPMPFLNFFKVDLLKLLTLKKPTLCPVPKSQHDPVEAICITFWSNGKKNHVQRMITVDPLKCLEHRSRAKSPTLRVSDDSCSKGAGQT